MRRRLGRRELRERNRSLTQTVLDALPDEVLDICSFDWNTGPREREEITRYLERARNTCPNALRLQVDAVLRVMEARFWLLDQSDAHEGETSVQLRILASSLLPSQLLADEESLRCHLAQNLPADDVASMYAASAVDR